VDHINKVDWKHTISLEPFHRSEAPSPEALTIEMTPAKQILINLFKTNPLSRSYYESSGGPPQAKEKDILGKLFEKYRSPLFLLLTRH